MNIGSVHFGVLGEEPCNCRRNRHRQHQSNRADNGLDNGHRSRLVVDKSEERIESACFWEFDAREEHRHHVRAEVGEDERIRHRPHDIASDVQPRTDRLPHRDIRVNLFDFVHA